VMYRTKTTLRILRVCEDENIVCVEESYFEGS
jgi:hypothetical protein